MSSEENKELTHHEKYREQRRKYRKEYYHRNPDYWKQKSNEYAANNTEMYLYKSARNRAKKSGIEFSIEVEDVIIPECCPYLGMKLTRDYGNGRTWYNPSIDRIDNTKGYVKGNIQVISDRANRMKVDASIEELITFAKGVLKNHTRD